LDAERKQIIPTFSGTTRAASLYYKYNQDFYIEALSLLIKEKYILQKEQKYDEKTMHALLPQWNSIYREYGIKKIQNDEKQ
jgi:hypothetical protein